MEAHTSRSATQEGSQSVSDGQTRSVGKDMSNQQLFLAEMKSMNAQMEARLSKEINKVKEDLTKDASKNKEDLTKLVTDTEGRMSKEISKLAIGYGKISAGAVVLATISAAVVGILRYLGR